MGTQIFVVSSQIANPEVCQSANHQLRHQNYSMGAATFTFSNYFFSSSYSKKPVRLSSRHLYFVHIYQTQTACARPSKIWQREGVENTNMTDCISSL